MTSLVRYVFGKRLPSHQAAEERLPNAAALAILSSDAISSVAYATEEILAVLVMGGVGATQWSMTVGVAIVGLLIILTISYQQLIRAYPSGGGAYTVAKENLGTPAGLLAASGLLIDYILTVAVSVSAGVAAMVSAFHWLSSFRVEMALLFLLILMVVNLRGVRETGRIFTLPTLLFVGSMFLMLAVGLVKYLLEGIPDISHVAPGSSETLNAVTLFLLMRAFSSGCTALTGIEAISNSTKVFRAPEVKHATRVLTWLAVILGILFVGTTFFASRYGIEPSTNQTVVSQLARLFLGHTPLYYILQITTLLVLLMAANTAFSGFPRLASMLGQDRYLPKQLSETGSRLVYTNGIILLTITSGILIAIFQGSVHRLIPIYAVGVFISFTLSQAGLVKHWLRLRGPGWIHGALINGLGAMATFIALWVIAITKFTHGAWVVTLLVPLFLWMFSRIHRHYEMVAEELSLDGFCPPVVPTRHTVIVPVSGMHRAVLKALAYSRSISADVRAVYIANDMTAAEALRDKWQKYAPDVSLEIIHSPYRMVINDLIKYLDNIQTQENTAITVVIPEFVPMHWWEMLLHSQTAWMLKASLLFRNRYAVTSVPHHLR